MFSLIYELNTSKKRRSTKSTERSVTLIIYNAVLYIIGAGLFIIGPNLAIFSDILAIFSDIQRFFYRISLSIVPIIKKSVLYIMSVTDLNLSDMKPGGIKLESDAVVFRKRAQ